MVRLIAFISVLILSACSPLPRLIFPKNIVPVANQTERCLQLLANYKNVNSFRGLIRSELYVDDSRISLRYITAFKSPDKFRFELLPEIGAFTLALIVSQGGMTTAMDVHSKEVIKTHTNGDELLQKAVGLQGISIDIVRALLTGAAPVNDCSATTIDKLTDSLEWIRTPSSTAIWEVESVSGKISRFYVLDEDRERILYEGLRSLDGDNVELKTYDPVRARVYLKFENVSINAPVKDSLFQVFIPDDYSIEQQ